MKFDAVLLLGTAVALAALAASAQRMPYPPGLRHAELSHIDYPPPAYSPQRGIAPQQLTREAGELNRLAGLVQKEIGMVNQGQLPGDLPKNLKQIEKLAHELHREISP